MTTKNLVKTPIREVKSNLSKYGDMAHNGQRIVVSKNGKPWFDLVPHQKKQRNVQPLENVTPTIDDATATAPVSKTDLEGWI